MTDTGVTINAGVRLETQYIANNLQNVDKLSVQNSWAPRVQAIWDFTGSGRGKVSGNWGRFFWNIPLDMGDRSFGLERDVLAAILNTLPVALLAPWWAMENKPASWRPWFVPKTRPAPSLPAAIT